MNKTCKSCDYSEEVGKRGYIGSSCQDCTRCKQHTDMWTAKVKFYLPPMNHGYPEPTCIGVADCRVEEIEGMVCKFKERCQARVEERRKFFAEGGTHEMWANGYRQFDCEGLCYRDHDSSPRCPKCGGTICSGDNPGSLCYECNSKVGNLVDGKWVPRVKT